MSRQRAACSGAFAFNCKHLARRRLGRNYYRDRGGLAGKNDVPPSSRKSLGTGAARRRDDDAAKHAPIMDADDEDELRRAVAVAMPEVLKRRFGANPSLEVLAALNGYGPVHAPPGGIRVPLGEGVIAEGRKGLERDYTVFARTTTNKVTTRSGRHPPFTTEDSTLYRILETRVEERFNRREERVRRWYEEKSRRVQSAYTDVVRRAEGVVSRSGAPGQDGPAGDEESSDDSEGHPSPPSEGERRIVADGGGEEDLLIHCRDGQVLLVEDVPTRHGPLVLPRAPSLPTPDPYRLGHGRSGTVVYGGLVLFGALPLTYRSASFALDHPVAARAAAASVVGSVSYSLWTARRAARTRRSLAVAEASASRIVARDEAARSVLMDGASESVSEAVVGVYLSRLKGVGERVIDGDDSDERNRTLLMFVDPVEVAADLGLLVRCDPGLSGVWTASDLRTACCGLYRRTFSRTDENFGIGDETTDVPT